MRHARGCGWVALAVVAVWGLRCSTGSAGPKSPPAPGKMTDNPLIVHEWGTFLSVQGSNGQTLPGMVDSDEVLPSFVDQRGLESWQRSCFNQKMETPVTYFYTNTPRDIRVRVEMPQGVLTHWYPSVKAYGPNPDPKAPPAHSFLDWRIVHLIPDLNAGASHQKDTALVPPAVTPREIWRFARETDAALVHVRSSDLQAKLIDQVEKFLFYRGLGSFSLPLSVQGVEPSHGNLHLVLQNRADHPLQGVFLISVEAGAIRFIALGDLSSHAHREVAWNDLALSPLPLETGVTQVKSAVAAALVGQGLYPKEAQAMVNAWEKSYFRSEGLRVLYVLPRAAVDSIIPIHIQPAPDDLVRVMVGRVEVLTPAREKQIEQFVAQLGAKDFGIRQAATTGLAHLGRISEPALHRVVDTTSDPEVRARARALIQKIGAGGEN